MKKLLTGLMAVVMMAGLAGCGSKDDGAGEGSDTAKKELTVYTNSGYKPYEMVDEKGNLYGFDIDVMNEAAKLAGYTVKWEDVDFDGIVPSVKQGKADIGIAGGIGEGLLIRKGEIVKKVKEEELLETLRQELLNWKR